MEDYSGPPIDDIDWSETAFSSPEEVIETMAGEKPVVRAFGQLELHRTFLEKQLEKLEERTDGLETLTLEGVERDDIMLIPEDYIPGVDLNEMSLGEALEELENSYSGNLERYIDDGIDTDRLMNDVRDLRETGRFEDFIESLYDSIILANVTYNALDNALEDEEPDDDLAPDEFFEDLYRVLGEEGDAAMKYANTNRQQQNQTVKQLAENTYETKYGPITGKIARLFNL